MTTANIKKGGFRSAMVPVYLLIKIKRNMVFKTHQLVQFE
jgi:hypothetical protein